MRSIAPSKQRNASRFTIFVKQYKKVTPLSRSTCGHLNRPLLPFSFPQSYHKVQLEQSLIPATHHANGNTLLRRKVSFVFDASNCIYVPVPLLNTHVASVVHLIFIKSVGSASLPHLVCVFLDTVIWEASELSTLLKIKVVFANLQIKQFVLLQSDEHQATLIQHFELTQGTTLQPVFYKNIYKSGTLSDSPILLIRIVD